jgi:hypothetical protein
MFNMHGALSLVLSNKRAKLSPIMEHTVLKNRYFRKPPGGRVVRVSSDGT